MKYYERSRFCARHDSSGANCDQSSALLNSRSGEQLRRGGESAKVCGVLISLASASSGFIVDNSFAYMLLQSARNQCSCDVSSVAWTDALKDHEAVTLFK